MISVKYAWFTHFVVQGPRKINPYFIPKVLLNTPPGIISMQYGFQVSKCSCEGYITVAK